ncbi:MAG: hypothetical protein E7011_03170 [Alphaproteobacteria bacterium]|nr:hypothetical protein [Alphaproteobacteria bacterium]
MYLLKKVFFGLCLAVAMLCPDLAYAGNIIDSLNLAPFVPMVLDAMMLVATGIYDFFVGNGNGFIYAFVWIFLGITITISLVKMYFPKQWLSFLGISGGGEIYDGKITGTQIVENTLKSGGRAIIAALFLLQMKPVFLTQWLVNPFLELGAIYTSHITEQINAAGAQPPKVECPPDILAHDWISQESCEFLVQPVSELSHANNQIIKRGFDSLTQGLKGLMTLIPHGGQDFMNIVTGIILILTFVSSNLFMALLIIQGIFNFGMQLILYPFYVLTYVVKPSDKWFDVWPAFSGITKALQQLIVTMIACAFMLCINLAVIRALFMENVSTFVVAAGGSAASNVPQIANSGAGFGQHSLIWMSAILTLYLMFKIYDKTQEQLKKYIGGGMDGLYNSVKSDAGTIWGNIKKTGKAIGTAAGWIKK